MVGYHSYEYEKYDIEYIKWLERKAQAFDEILNITQLQHEEEYADDVISVIDKYKEDTKWLTQ